MSLQVTRNLRTVLFSEKILHEKSNVILYFIFGIAFYIPFEDLITIWLPLPNPAISAIRILPELLIYAILFRIVLLHFRQGIPLKKTPIDPLLISFIFCCIISVIANQADPIRSTNYLRVTWRYVAIYYTIVNIEVPSDKIDSLLTTLRNIGIFEGIFASLQFFIPASIKVAFAKGACDKALTKGSSCGSFTDSATLAGFLLISITLLIAYLLDKNSWNKHWGYNASFIALSYFGLFASKKRAALLVIAFVPALMFRHLKRRRFARTYIWLGISLGIVILFIVPILTTYFGLDTQESSAVQTDASSYFLRIFSTEYWDDFFLNARGWFIATIFDSLIQSGSIFGFSPHLPTTISRMVPYMDQAVNVIKLDRDRAVFYDPYWFSQLASYGIIGLSIYWGILLQLYRTSYRLIKTKITKEHQYIGAIFCSVILISFLYSFVERLFMLRTFSYYFWLFAGIVANLNNTLKTTGKGRVFL